MRLRHLLLIAVLAPVAGQASQPFDDFDAFITGSMKEFNSFITEANREYLDFMRNPWKEYQGEKPVEKRVTPEPVEAPVFNPQSQESKEPPKQLTIREILDLTSAEGKQGKTVDATPVFSVPEPSVKPEPQQPVTPKPTPEKPSQPKKVIIRDTIKAQQPAPVSPTKPAPVKQTPVQTVPAAPVKQTPETPVTKPESKPVSKPVATPSQPRRQEPLYAGGEGRRRVNFYGIDYYVSDGLDHAITLSGVNEKAVTAAFESLYTSDYKPLLEDLRTLRANDLHNDWALYLLVKQIAEMFAGRDESVVMRQFLLNSLGLRARVARVADTGRLSLMVAPSVQLYGCLYVTEGGTRFYDVEASKPYAFYMCPKEAPDAKLKIDMSMAQMPRMGAARKSATRTAPRYGTTVQTTVPTQKMEFYNRIPQCDYSVYANAQVDSEFAERLLSSLRPAIEGKNEKDAANILLDFCQNGFEYATDPEQFGYEKPFFAEELFNYPKCDCEDRSILYRYLVKSLLGLDVVLLDYPNHIATAVKFAGDYAGDHVMVNGRKYLVCDPTYMGASIGMAMPQFKNVAANVLKY